MFRFGDRAGLSSRDRLYSSNQEAARHNIFPRNVSDVILGPFTTYTKYFRDISSGLFTPNPVDHLRTLPQAIAQQVRSNAPKSSLRDWLDRVWSGNDTGVLEHGVRDMSSGSPARSGIPFEISARSAVAAVRLFDSAHPSTLYVHPLSELAFGLGSVSNEDLRTLPPKQVFNALRDAVFPNLRVLRIGVETQGYPGDADELPQRDGPLSERHGTAVAWALESLNPTVLQFELPLRRTLFQQWHMGGSFSTDISVRLLLEQFSKSNARAGQGAPSPVEEGVRVLAMSRIAPNEAGMGQSSDRQRPYADSLHLFFSDSEVPTSERLSSESFATSSVHYFAVRDAAELRFDNRMRLGGSLPLPSARFVSFVNVNIYQNVLSELFRSAPALESLRLWNSGVAPEGPEVFSNNSISNIVAKQLFSFFQAPDCKLRALDLGSVMRSTMNPYETLGGLDVLESLCNEYTERFCSTRARRMLNATRPLFPPGFSQLRVVLPFEIPYRSGYETGRLYPDHKALGSFAAIFYSMMRIRNDQGIGKIPGLDQVVLTLANALSYPRRVEFRPRRPLGRNPDDSDSDSDSDDDAPYSDGTEAYMNSLHNLRDALLNLGFGDVRISGLVRDFPFPGPYRATVATFPFAPEDSGPGAFPKQGTLCSCDVCQAFAARQYVRAQHLAE